MNQRQGFTLVEALLSLGVVALLLGLTTGWGRYLSRPSGVDSTAPYVMIQALERPGRYEYVGLKEQGILLKDHFDAEKVVWLTVNERGILGIGDQLGRGHLPILTDVTALEWQPVATTGTVILRVKRGRRAKWQTALLDLRAPSGDL